MAFFYVGDFPGEVEGVLDAGVAAEAVELWVLVSISYLYETSYIASSVHHREDETDDCIH